MIRALAFAALVLTGAANADAFRLGFPVDCTLGETCFIQNYMDSDPSEAVQDFTCGPLSYDGHSGTDIAVPDLQAMHEGVAIFPVAPGIVRATRDEMPDINARDPNAPDLKNRSCGNAVVIDHGAGWGTRYCHMKRGSVAVRTGERVTMATEIGQIGLSGRTEFPHLHITVTKDGRPVDPFNLNAAQKCGAPYDSAWASPIDYRAGGLLDIGFSSALPSFAEIKAGTAGADVLPPTGKALVLWAHVFGTLNGDELLFSIQGPKGVFLEQTVTLDRTQARAFRAVGRKLRADGWPRGTYIGQVVLQRRGKPMGTQEIFVSVIE